jgi:hypothetical protein
MDSILQTGCRDISQFNIISLYGNASLKMNSLEKKQQKIAQAICDKMIEEERNNFIGSLLGVFLAVAVGSIILNECSKVINQNGN